MPERIDLPNDVVVVNTRARTWEPSRFNSHLELEGVVVLDDPERPLDAAASHRPSLLTITHATRSGSATQNPEKLYRQTGFFVYMVLTTVVFVVLMFTSVPSLYSWFNVEPSTTSPLWTLDGK